MSKYRRHAPRTALDQTLGDRVRVLVVEDAALVRERLAGIISSVPEIALVGAAADGRHARLLFDHYQPDAVVLDLQLPDTNGIALLEEFKAEHPGCVVIVFTTYDFAALAKRCATLGADHFLQKHTQFDKVREVLSGMAFRRDPGIARSHPVPCRRAGTAEETKLNEPPHRNPELVYAALEASANAIVITDAEGSIQWVNQAFSRLTGYSRGEITGKNPRLLKSGWQSPEAYDSLWSTILAGRVWQGELINRRKDGTMYVERGTITPLKGALERITHFIAVKEDITSEKAIQEALQESENRFRTVFDLAPDAIYLTDLNGRCVDTNRAGERMFRKTKADLLGRSLLELTLASGGDAAKVRRILARVSQDTPTGPDELELSQPEGGLLTVELRTFPVTLGKQSLILWVGRDITERKRLEHQYHQSQKLQAVGQLAGGVAHDFNNLLAVMRGYAELLLMDPAGLPDRAREALEHIVQAGDRAANLTRQLLMFSRKEAIQPKVQCLNHITSNLTKMLKRLIGEHIELSCRLEENLPLVEVDTGMIEQVLVNLVVNARDAMPRGGVLRIETARASLDQAQPTAGEARRAGEFVCLKVCDTGIGIAPEHLPRIFEPFFTTKPVGKGTGLGLATVYGIIGQHNGWVQVESHVGAGTGFQIFLPVVSHPQEAPSAAAAGMANIAGTETILLVEDEATVRSVSRRVLESSGYRVLEAGSGPEALQLWKVHGDEIALLVTDVVMPQGMTGIELSEQLQASRPGLKTILMTGYSSEHVSSDTEFIRRNTRCFVSKPCAAQVLLETVRRTLDEKE